jgi:hypothetical protein
MNYFFLLLIYFQNLKNLVKLERQIPSKKMHETRLHKQLYTDLDLIVGEHVVILNSLDVTGFQISVQDE